PTAGIRNALKTWGGRSPHEEWVLMVKAESQNGSAARLSPVPADRLREGNFVSAAMGAPDSLIYFLLNVGDGDTQLVLLPAEEDGTRRALVIDVATTSKLPRLVESLADE